MNFNLVEMYNGLLRFNKHILNELAEGLKHLPNLDGVSKGDSLIINEQGNPAWGSAAFIPTFENGLIPPLDGSDGDVGVRVPEFYMCVKDTGTKYQQFDFRFGPYFVPNKVGTNKKADYNSKRDNDGQDTDKAVRVLLLGGGAHYGSSAGSGFFYSNWVRSGSLANVGFFTTVKLD